MKKKRNAVLVLICLLLAGCLLGWNAFSHYSIALEANWGFALPFKALYRELYAKDSGPSFHGDGIRYHVYSYKYEDYIDLMFAWKGTEGSTIYNKPYSQEVTQWLNEIEVPDEWHPDYDKGNCGYWYKSRQDNSQIIVIWNQMLNRLYIAEHFI